MMRQTYHSGITIEIMPKHAEYQVDVTFIAEGNQIVAYSTALEFATAGDNLEEARANFHEGAGLLLEELRNQGRLEEELQNLGWIEKEGVLTPPQIVAHSLETIAI
jgi:predicted RNase H-like HicB family nuclease